MVFKPRSKKPREPTAAEKIMEKISGERDAQRTANEAYEAGRACEADEDEEGAIGAYLASVDAWEAYHKQTGYAVESGPYERLAILFRRIKEPGMEVEVLQRYLQRAGRTPNYKLQDRLERAYELLEMAQAELEDDEL